MAKQKAYIELNAPLTKLKKDLLKAQALVAKNVKIMSANIKVGLTGAYGAAGASAKTMGVTTVAAGTAMGRSFGGVGDSIDKLNKITKNTFDKLNTRLGKNIKKTSFLKKSWGGYKKGVITAGKAQWQSLKNVGGAVVGIGKKLIKLTAVAAAAGVALALAFAGVGIKKAIAFEESETFFKKTFGKMEKDVRDWSEALQVGLGVSADEARGFSATLNTMTKSMGMGEKEAKDMSKRLVELTYDLSSARNVPVSEAFNKIRSALTGTGMGMKQLGYIIDDETIKAHAYTTGITEQGKALTAQQKVLARYQVMLKSTAEVHGDLAATNTSTKNTLRRLQNNISDLQREIGNKFIPVFYDFLKGLDIFIKVHGPAMLDMAENMAKNFAALPVAFEILGDEMDTTMEKARIYAEYWKKDPIGNIRLHIDPVWTTIKAPFKYLDNLVDNSAKYARETLGAIFEGEGRKVDFDHTTMSESWEQLQGEPPEVIKAWEKAEEKLRKLRESKENAAHKAAMERLKEKNKIEVAFVKSQSERDKAKLKRIENNLAAEKAADEEKRRMAEREKNRAEGMRKFVGRFGGTSYSYAPIDNPQSTKPASPISAPDPISFSTPSSAIKTSTASKYTLENVVKAIVNIEERLIDLAGQSLNAQTAIT